LGSALISFFFLFDRFAISFPAVSSHLSQIDDQSLSLSLFIYPSIHFGNPSVQPINPATLSIDLYDQGCQIFLCTKYQSGKNIDQITTTYTKCP
jgi:hypothetical protein